MGALTFSDLEITILSKDAALVLGRWHLKRANDDPHGTFSLLFRKTKAGWRIVHDHSSRREPGTRAPSPALSAKRERSVTKNLTRAVLAGAGEAPALPALAY
jgi:hypothetical protein